jgi:4-hydroxybenzoate polyprenyltransferase
MDNKLTPPYAESSSDLLRIASALWRAMRPRQWTKNIVVLAAFFFALGDKQQHISPLLFGYALLAAALFSLVSSAVYLFNDILDRDLDRAHPVKRLRPLASGQLSITVAWGAIFVLLAAGMGGAWLVTPKFALTLIAYVALQVFYTLWLKHIALVDVFIIAIGFVLRAFAGGCAVDVHISPWLLICTFLMALFLALCKRRHEKHLAAEMNTPNFRPSLNSGNERLFDQLIGIMAGAVIVTYAIYTQWPDTVAKFDTPYLCLTIPFVIFGVFRYLDLVYRQAQGDQPESILLTDLPLIIDILFFGLSVWWIIVIA